MGANNVKQNGGQHSNKAISSDRMRNSIEDEPVLNLSEEHKELLKETWITLKGDISKVGVITFMKLFETHPDVQDAFLPFRGLSTTDMEQSAILRAHALRVMMTVDKCLNRIDSPSKVEGLMGELGRRHLNYNIKPEYIDMMGEQFIYALRTNLDDRWSPELEKAWIALFNMMKFYMRRGLTEKQK
ncbi:neuroglobin-like [Haliotis cracherodii]|uniref:neuroglobin-like n=1 Tax=Haliotis cracherodii TaxID=6455 RepID=UPI0039EAF392